MRSLVLLDATVRKVISPTDEAAEVKARLAAMAPDPSSDVVYTITESAGPDGVAQLVVFKLDSENASQEEVARWNAESAISLVAPIASIVKSFKFLPESDSLAVVLASGDIEQIFAPSSSSSSKRENVGCVDAGIASAAWSPDEELLVLITGDDKLIVMTKDFEVLSEGPLRTSDFGEDAPVNVGWGDKSTQFHGSVGKSAASAAGPSVSSMQSSPDDDGQPRVSWRGDSAFFSISSLDSQASTEKRRRVVRFFTRLGVLSSTSEPTDGLEHSLAWQPAGTIIASSQKRFLSDGESHHVVFFERNGLRRYDFALREAKDDSRPSAKVRELAWNSDSTLLAVWMEREGVDTVQLWHRNNYQWYLKQEVTTPDRITSLTWHPERSLDLFLVTEGALRTFAFCWDVLASCRAAPNDDGAVAVTFGSKLNLTPFRFQNVPPPMCTTTLESSRPNRVPVHVAFAQACSAIAVLYLDGFVEVWDWALPSSTRGKAREDIPPPTLAWSAATSSSHGYALQCAIIGGHSNDATVAVLSVGQSRSVALVQRDGSTRVVQLPRGTQKIVSADRSILLQTSTGSLLEVSSSAEDGDSAAPSETLAELPEFCPWMRQVSTSSAQLVIGLTAAGRLYAGSRLLANDASSFTCTSDFVIFTTFAHEAKFVPLNNLDVDSGLPPSIIHVESAKKQYDGDTTLKRALERGSRIVTVVPSATSLVLQMPRGNLETVCPRPLVLQVVRQDLDAHRYRSAFMLCRRHRIDLNILHDHDPKAFLSHLSDFVGQIKSVDHLNLFLSGLKNEDVTHTMYRPLLGVDPLKRSPDVENKINSVCDAVRVELEQRDAVTYAHTILTAHVRKRPADYESALKVLTDLKAIDAEKAEDAVKYIIFLSDANKLFDIALGMNDFALVLLIAQQSQKDPREYLPFLRELRSLDKYIQRHRIDDHLERHESALRNLLQAGPEHFDAAMEYTKRHSLYKVTLEVVRDDPNRYRTVLGLTAEHNMQEKRYAEAGLLFNLGGQLDQAIVAYQKALAWPELFSLLLANKKPAAEIKATAVEVAERLSSKSRFADAARVILDYGRDVDAAVTYLDEGSLYGEAIRLTHLYGRKDLIETHVKPATLESQSRIVDDVGEVADQLDKQLERFVDLKERKEQLPTQYFLLDSAQLDNVELQPDGASDAGTAFTRYTVAPTTAATSQISSGRSARSRRRGGLKRAAGKKGTVYEEMYLLRSVVKTVENKLSELQNEVKALLPVLLNFQSPAHRQAAIEVQSELTNLEKRLGQAIDVVWTPREREWAEERAAEERERDQGTFVAPGQVDEVLEKVLRPKLSTVDWRLGLLDALG